MKVNILMMISVSETQRNYYMKVETTLPLKKGARILQYTKDESLASFQRCLLGIAHNKQEAKLT